MAATLARKPSSAFKAFLNNTIRPNYKGRNLSDANVLAEHAMKAPQLASFYKKHPEVPETLKKFHSFIEKSDKLVP